MKPKEFDPLRLDVAAFAAAGASLAGQWPLPSLPRLAESASPDVPVPEGTDVNWSAQGEERRRAGGRPEIWLRLQASGRLALQCQRCLAPVVETLDFERRFRFVDGEQAAAALDAESEDDVLELRPRLDLRELVEDELLLALPLVPRHAVCPQPLESPPEPAAPDEVEPPHPFAALRALKERGPRH